MKDIKLAASSPILAVEGNLVFASNGNVVLGYTLSLPEIHSLSATDFEALHSICYS
ncbi:DUF3875 domain-containing protein [Flagellimonas sp. HMM57]|uniref:DUF3875 domain-containing protein n=1 Tax=unclassified Flagellimonas TaxID=2644544 RepID=UPI0013D008A2|nr:MULTISPECIES: DUF3875 domain-containing protein [unclassified Flagellimonas]UII76425.1 DUF3875 domain-containing protein [Flagellimonas sp. HMM57]